MKPEQPNQRERERARQIEELLERLNPLSDRIMLGYLIVSVLVPCILFFRRMDAVDISAEPLLGALGVLSLLIFFLTKWLTSPKKKAQMKQRSIEELASLFEGTRKIMGHFFALSAVGFGCWIVSTLIGMFDFSFQLFTGFCAGILSAGLMYRHYRRTEQLARQLAEQDDS